MSAPMRTLSESSQHSDSPRKRISKACDRCRLKKSKCNGDSPCSRCTADNAICVFGERKRAHDRVYPKGYVEMLEQQQSQLVAGLQETYRRLNAAKSWPGPALDEREGRPLTHDILSALDIIHHKPDGQLHLFEESPEKLQQRLLANGAPYMHRRGSFSSDSDHSTTHSHSHSHSHKRARSSQVDSPAQSPKAERAPTQAHQPHQPSPLHADLAELDRYQVVDEDTLMSSFPWQDLAGDMGGQGGDDPRFAFSAATTSFPNPGQWPDLAAASQFGGLFTPQPLPGGVGTGYTNMQQLQRDPLDIDLGAFVPVGAS